MPFPIVRRRFNAVLAALFVAWFAGPGAAQPLEQTPVPWVEEQAASGPLRGVLTVPAGQGPFPATLIIAGSGPVNRDGNLRGMPNDSLKRLAHGLAERGIASLRFDKRGVAASKVEMAEDDYSVAMFVDDAAGWLKLMRADPRLTAPGVIGHSEGAIFAILLAQRADAPSRIVLLAGPGEKTGRILERQMTAAATPAPLAAASRRIAEAMEQGRRVDDIPPELAALYRPSIQNYLMTLFPIDPAAELAKTAVPALIVQGTADLQVVVEDARRLAAARPDAGLALIDGMNHILRDAPVDRAANFATYTQPEKPLSPGLLPAIADFVKR